MLVLVALVGIGGIVLVAGGSWALGVIALLAAAIVFLLRREVERGKAVRALGDLRLRAAAAREAVAARSREQLDLFRARRELAELEAERSARLRRLGEAVFDGDESGTETARAAVAAVDERIHEKEAEIETLRQETEQRVRRAHSQAQPTERLAEVPEPVRVPEPWPPPDEAQIPEPDPTPPPSEPVPEPEEPGPQTER